MDAFSLEPSTEDEAVCVIPCHPNVYHLIKIEFRFEGRVRSFGGELSESVGDGKSGFTIMDQGRSAVDFGGSVRSASMRRSCRGRIEGGRGGNGAEAKKNNNICFCDSWKRK